MVCCRFVFGVHALEEKKNEKFIFWDDPCIAEMEATTEDSSAIEHVLSCSSTLDLIFLDDTGYRMPGNQHAVRLP